MNSHIRRCLALCLALSATRAVMNGSSCVSAGIITTTGSLRIGSAPASTNQGAWESNKRTRLFQEQSAIALDQDVNVDMTGPGVYASPEDCILGSVSAGTVVDSFLLHQDPKGRRHSIMLHGSITFDQDILGVIVSRDNLNASDSMFGVTGTLYPTGTEMLRGLDFPRAHDKITISDDRRTLSYDLQTQVALDHVRILTAVSAVPGPGSLALLGIAGLTAVRRRRSA